MPELLKNEILKTPTTKNFKVVEPIRLESGDVLEKVNIRFTTYGKLNEEKSNVVWVFHALTGNSDFTEWWDGLNC